MNILKPLEIILKYIFDWTYSITNNYGISLIIMSLIVTVGTGPLYYLADIWKKKEDCIQLEMKKEIDDIKRAFSGKKQFYMIQATYRMHNYKTYYALRAALGLLIQVPFFFAAYNMLSSYSGYKGYSFLCFSDLSMPDSLLYGINVLPIIMTIINIISSIIYTRSFSVQDNKQLFILSVVFFVFLYNSPSALLIYWTNNNILSLLKSYFLNKNKSLKFLSNDEKTNIKEIFYFCTSYFFFLLSLFIINHKQAYTKYVLIINFIVLIGIISINFVKQSKTPIKFLTIVLKNNFIISVLLISSIYLYIFKPSIKYINLYPLDKLLMLICIYLFITNQIIVKLNIDTKSIAPKNTLIISYILFLVSAIIIFPIKYFISSPEEIESSFSQLLLTSLFVFVLLSIIFIILIRKGKILTQSILIFLIICSLLNILFPLKSGVISGFELSLYNVFQSVSIENFSKDVFIGFTSIIIFYFLYKKNISYIKYFSIIICCIPLFQIITILRNNEINFKTNKQNLINEFTSLPEKYYLMHSLSKDRGCPISMGAALIILNLQVNSNLLKFKYEQRRKR